MKVANMKGTNSTLEGFICLCLLFGLFPLLFLEGRVGLYIVFILVSSRPATLVKDLVSCLVKRFGNLSPLHH